MFALLFDVALAWLVLLVLAVAAAIVREGQISRRLVLADLSVLLLVGVLTLMTMRQEAPYYLAAALALALLSFIGNLVVAIHAAEHPGPADVDR